MHMKDGKNKGIGQAIKAMSVVQKVIVTAVGVIIVGGGIVIGVSVANNRESQPVDTSSIDSSIPTSSVASVTPSEKEESSAKTSSEEESSASTSSETSSQTSSAATSSAKTSSTATSSAKTSSTATSSTQTSSTATSSTQTSSTEDSTSSASSEPPKQSNVDLLPTGYQERFADLYAKNKDLVGWIKYTGKLDYPVLQTTDNAYYIDHDINKKRYVWGNPYMDYRCTVGASKNTIVYSHSNPKDGTGFMALKGLRKVDFYKQHPTVKFDTVYGDATYKIIAFFVENTKPGTEFFPYHMFINQTDSEYIDNFMENAKLRSFINTTVDYTAEDEFLTISTCWDTNGKNYDRLITVARKVRSGESASVDTSGATQNTSQKLPAGGLYSTAY